MTRTPYRSALYALGLLCLSLPALAQEPLVALRYDLRPGDHLVYHQSLERETTGGRVEALSRASWTTHVLVADEHAGSMAVGFQRNRESYELVRFKLDGEDRSERERKRAAPVLARTARYAEANRLTASGAALLFWQVVRESGSKILYDFHEIQPLPEHPVGPGDTWQAPSVLGLRFRAVAWEPIAEQRCLRSEGVSAEGNVSVRYWFCPATGTLARLEYEGTYPGFLRGITREKLKLELVERRREEEPEEWLAQPDLQHGLMAALLVADTLPLEVADLYAVLDGGDAELQRRVLALAYRRRLTPPSVEQLSRLLGSAHPRVRTLAVRALESDGSEVARPLIERALRDPDYFVRQAALAWMRARLPAAEAVHLRDPARALAAWDRISPDPQAGTAKKAPPSGAGDGAGSSVSRCEDPEAWTEDILRRRSFRWEPEDVRPRAMTSGPDPGWPYLVRIPEDYRGDEPFPLLIYLSGNSGPAIEGALIGTEPAAQTGYIVVYPHAGGFWWKHAPTARMHALLGELMRTFNIDPRRIFIAGVSNGGTGAAYYATLFPHRFAAVVSQMGAGFFIPEVEADALPQPANAANLPMLWLHGALDRTIGASATTESVEQLKPHRAPLEMHIFPDWEHEVTLARDEGMTLKFLERFERQAFPRLLTFTAQTLQYPRHYWLEILEKEKGDARVKAELRDDNTIRLRTDNVRRLRLLLRPELLPRPGNISIEWNGKPVFSGELRHDCALLQRSLESTADPFLAYTAELTLELPR
ncbi:MAG TPA: HEAT repeat domain-containing protein [Terriglobales bacterium]|nr:HEAT repeat domain-containing protein [Terriglobales bacterium]